MNKLNKAKLSVVIPTLNEEKYLPLLLDALKKQTFNDFEVIIVDGNSADRTLELAQQRNRELKIKTIVEKKRGIGLARNIGARAAVGEHILFLDADVRPEPDFLKECLEEFIQKKADIATTRIRLISKKEIDKALQLLANFEIIGLQKIVPIAPGFCILCRRKVFDALSGFDEAVKMGEDVNFVQRAVNHGFKFRIMMKQKIPVSARRLELEGRLKLLLKYYASSFYWLFLKGVKTGRFNYKFGEYKD